MTQPTRITATDPEAQSADLIAGNIAKLKELFPEAFTEGKIDFEVLKQLLGGAMDERDEKYGLTWHGKRLARQLALTPSLGTLRPCPAESVDWDTTKNLMIEGDNLEVLKLLQKSYAGKVKLIYIDPPYNTGSDFVYPDNFQDSIENYQRITGQRGEDGARRSANSEFSGRFHGQWLSMMYARLRLAKNLLTPDGVILISIDEGEQVRLRAIMDEIYGEENFVADLIWSGGRKNDSRFVSISHEYIVVYVRDQQYLKDNQVEWRQRKKGLDEIYGQYSRLRERLKPDHEAITQEMKSWYSALPDSHPAKNHRHYSHSDDRGLYFPDNISWPGGGGPTYEVLHQTTGLPVKVPSRGWMFSDPAKMAEAVRDRRVHFGPDERSVPCIKSYLKDREFQAPYSVFYQDGRAATKRLRDLMGGDCFDFPKDERVLQELFAMLTKDDDIIMDCFAGSGTTGHAVMAQNANDGGRRRYLLVQLPEPLDPANKEQSESANYCDSLGKPRSIAELTKERLRRVSTKLQAEHPALTSDLGFRVFKLDASNIATWEPRREDLATSIQEHIDHLKPGRTQEDLLFEILLKYGLDLASPITTATVGEVLVHRLGGGVLTVCLSDGITAERAEALGQGLLADLAAQGVDLADARLVFKDHGFVDDAAKTNLMAILTQGGIQADHLRTL